MNFFTEIPEGQAIIRNNGVYRQVPLYGRGENVYAKFGAGFIKISIGGATSHPRIRCVEYEPGMAEIEEKDGRAPRLLRIHERPRIVEAAE